MKYFNNIQISFASAGCTHTIFVDTIGKVYAVGYNRNEQLGLTNNVELSNYSKDELDIYWLVTNAGENQDDDLIRKEYKDSDGNLVYEYELL